MAEKWQHVARQRCNVSVANDIRNVYNVWQRSMAMRRKHQQRRISVISAPPWRKRRNNISAEIIKGGSGNENNRKA